MKVAIPTLTTSGFVTDPNIIIVKLYEYFLTSDYSQSVIFYNKIASLPYLIHKHGPKLDDLRADVETTLNDLMDNYFNVFDVKVEINEVPHDKKSKHPYTITIELTATVDNKKYYLNKNLNIKESKILELDKVLEYFYE